MLQCRKRACRTGVARLHGELSEDRGNGSRWAAAAEVATMKLKLNMEYCEVKGARSSTTLTPTATTGPAA
jgi:hypothetical protein